MSSYDDLIRALKHDEGLRLEAYPDPVSHGPPWTIGYGHTGKNVHPGMVVDQATAEAFLFADVQNAQNALGTSLPWAGNLSSPRWNVLANMTFNMGLATLLTFHHTLEAIRTGDYAQAGEMMLESRWAKQVGARAQRLARQMETGVEQPLV